MAKCVLWCGCGRNLWVWSVCILYSTYGMEKTFLCPDLLELRLVLILSPLFSPPFPLVSLVVDLHFRRASCAYNEDPSVPSSCSVCVLSKNNVIFENRIPIIVNITSVDGTAKGCPLTPDLLPSLPSLLSPPISLNSISPSTSLPHPHPHTLPLPHPHTLPPSPSEPRLSSCSRANVILTSEGRELHHHRNHRRCRL